jgi:hypothetical protein
MFIINEMVQVYDDNTNVDSTLNNRDLESLEYLLELFFVKYFSIHVSCPHAFT